MHHWAFEIGDWGLGIKDWGLGIKDWGLGKKLKLAGIDWNTLKTVYNRLGKAYSNLCQYNPSHSSLL